ncbi:MAG TPA: AsmA-like C-terminal region-containing protein [Elusimicrobiota bacterium]|nr:AsmA-like C-terminal region-containing protein [Elusimicrobiota bacterium]
MKGAPYLLKAAVSVLLLAVLGAGALVVAVKVFFPEPRARAWFVDAARRQLGRDVRLRRIDVGLTGLSLRGLEVSELPGFEAGTFLRVEDFRLRPSWRALLRRRLVVAAVAADGLEVRVVKGADGHFNFDTLASSAPPAAVAPATPAASAAGPETEFKVRRASISNGRVEYFDAAGSSWTASDLDLEISGFGPGRPFGLRTSFRLRGEAGTRPVDASVAFDGTVDLGRGGSDGFKAAATRLVVEQGGLKLAATGSFAGLDEPRLLFDAGLSSDGRGLLAARGTAILGPAGTQVDAAWKTPGLDAALLARLLPGSGLPAVDVPEAEGAVSGTFSAGAADVRTARAFWAGGKLEGAASARGLGGASPSYEGRVSFGFDAPAIRRGQYPFLRLPPKLALPASRLDGTLSLKGGVLTVSGVTAKFPQGTISASGAVRGALSAKPVPDLAFALALDLPRFELSALPFPVAGLPGTFAVPAGSLRGGVRALGEDVRLEKLAFKGSGVSVSVDGVVSRALAGAPSPALGVEADLTLPALTGADLPFRGAPAGLSLPPARWTLAGSYSPRVIRLKSLRARAGRNDVEASGTIADPSGREAYDLVFKCRSFDLRELTELTPRTRGLQLAGSGFFALSVTGVKDKPVFAGKARFQGLGATVEGLPLSDFAGTISFDADRLDVPDLMGRFGDGRLRMDLTVKDFSRAPDVELEASLDRFDLGRYLAAKAKLAAERAAAAPAEAAKAPSGGKPALVSTRGNLTIGTLVHPNATVTGVKVGWDLRGVGADFSALSGDAKFRVGGGQLRSAGDMALQSKLVKVLIFPLLVVQKLGRIGGIRLFPDFNDITLSQIVGDYGFSNGVMTLRQSEMDSDAAQVVAKGTIDLPAEALDLLVTAQVGSVAPIDVAVTGTFDNPKSKMKLAKFLATPAKQLIQSLLTR